MNRKSFLKKIGLGAIIAAVAPKAIAWKEPKIFASADPAVPGGNIMFAIDASRIPDGMELEEFIRKWRDDNGTIIYRANSAPKIIPAERPAVVNFKHNPGATPLDSIMKELMRNEEHMLAKIKGKIEKRVLMGL